jgi:predicted acyltransferase
LRWLVLVGAACLALGWVASLTICPMIKRIWTPSFALWSVGWTLWLLAMFYAVIDAADLKRWSFPLVVVGMNSIAMYLMAQLWQGWIRTFLKTHITAEFFTGPYAPMCEQTGVLLVLWLVCWWLYRQRVFLRI